MRILLIHNRWGDDVRGGAERIVERLADGLRAAGHDVAVYHRTTVGFHALARMPALLRACWHAWDVVNPITALMLARHLTMVRPDVVHTHNLVGCGGLTPWIIRRYCARAMPSDRAPRCVWVHTLHDVQLLSPSGIWIGDRPATVIERSFVGACFRMLRRFLIGSPTVVTSPTHWLLDLHTRERFFPRSERRIMQNPITLPPPVPPRSGAVRRFCFVGQIEGAKGVHVLVEAFLRLLAFAPDATLQVVGDGAMHANVKAAYRGVRGIIIRGRLDAEGVRTVLGESDVLVVPSLVAENQPSAILEAFAFGVPVIASRIGGIPELVTDGVTGLLADAGSTDDFLRCLRTAVEDPQRIRSMRAACRVRAESHDTAAIVTAYTASYAQQ